MKETIQDVLQLILQADDIKYVKNSGILNYGLDLKQVVEREIELSVCKGDKEILLAMNYDIEQCSVQFQIVDCTEEEEKKIIDLYFALNGAEATVDFTKALNLYLLSIGYIDEGVTCHSSFSRVFPGVSQQNGEYGACSHAEGVIQVSDDADG